MKNWLAPENRFLATPLDLLEQGVTTRNWDAVDAAWIAITGKPLPKNSVEDTEIPAKKKRGRPPKQKPVKLAAFERDVQPAQQLTDMKKNNLPQEVPPSMRGCVATIQTDEQKQKSKSSFNKHDCSPHPNTWTDTLTEAVNEIVPDRQVPSDILNSQRPPSKLIKVTCCECGDVNEVDPSIVSGLRLTKKYKMKYRCNDCIVGAKSGIALDRDLDDNDEVIDDE